MEGGRTSHGKPRVLDHRVLGSLCRRSDSVTFNIPASVPLTEETIKQAVLRVLPEGSLAISIKPKLLDLGIGEKGLSNYGESGKDNVAVIRIEYDPKTIDVVKRSYIISLYLTSEPIRTVQYITVKEWLTGP